MCPWNGPKFVQLAAERDYRARADAVAALLEALDDDSELVREHAAWALERSTRSGHR